MPIIGTSAGHRSTWRKTASASSRCCERAGSAPAAESHRAHRRRGAPRLAEEIGYPLVVRPSYVLGGRAMEIVHEQRDLERYMREAVQGVQRFAGAARPVPRRRDRSGRGRGIADGDTCCIGGIMEHIEQAGVHSGDSACSLPPYSLARRPAGRAAPPDRADGEGLNVVGLMNVQFAIQRKDGRGRGLCAGSEPARVAHGAVRVQGDRRPLAKIAARCMAGSRWRSRAHCTREEVVPPYFSVKEAVFPFVKFQGSTPSSARK